MKVKVTQKHIDQGCPGWGQWCPVAMALEEMGFARPVVGSQLIIYRAPDTGEVREWDTPRKVFRFMQKFDSHRKVKPFTFKLK